MVVKVQSPCRHRVHCVRAPPIRSVAQQGRDTRKCPLVQGTGENDKYKRGVAVVLAIQVICAIDLGKHGQVKCHFQSLALSLKYPRRPLFHLDDVAAVGVQYVAGLVQSGNVVAQSHDTCRCHGDYTSQH